MKEKINKIISEITGIKQGLENIPGLISRGYIDSFQTLILINTLELEFKVKFDFNDNLVKHLDSVNKIEELLKMKLASCKNAVNPVQEWEEIYNSSSFREKNKYPYPEIVGFVMRNFGNIADKAKVKILDLGCGWGNNLAFLKDQGFDYYGIEFSKSAVEYCRKAFKNVTLGDISELPYASNFFNCVFDRMAILHNPKEKIKKIFSEVHRVLKVDGLFLSILAAKANYSVFATYLTEEDIKEFAKTFAEIKIDYVESSENNQAQVSKNYLLTAKK